MSIRTNIPESWRNIKAIYNTLFKKQKGCCAICGVHQSKLNRALALDHCHTTEMIRGLLCFNCNLALGLMVDNVKNILNAAIYLERNYGRRTDCIEQARDKLEEP